MLPLLVLGRDLFSRKSVLMQYMPLHACMGFAKEVQQAPQGRCNTFSWTGPVQPGQLVVSFRRCFAQQAQICRKARRSARCNVVRRWRGALQQAVKASYIHTNKRPPCPVARHQARDSDLPMRACAGVVFQESKVEGVAHSDGASELCCADGVRVPAAMVLDATGHSRRLVQFDAPFDPGYQVRLVYYSSKHCRTCCRLAPRAWQGTSGILVQVENPDPRC